MIKGQPYSVLLGPNGFDDMDDHILKDILGLLPDGKQAQQITSILCPRRAGFVLNRCSY